MDIKLKTYFYTDIVPTEQAKCKKIIDNKRLVSERTSTAYQQDFRRLGMTLNDKLS